MTNSLPLTNVLLIFIIRFLSRHFKCHKQLHNYHRMSHLTDNLSIPKPLIAVCQMTATANKEDNFIMCKSLIENAKFRGVQVS